MSDRPTISVYFDRHIADVGYYRNWESKDIFYEAMAIAMLYGNCTSAEDYKLRRYGSRKISKVLEPEVFEDSEEDLKWLESCSEMPVIVDMTEKCIYYSENGALNRQEIDNIPSILEARDNYGIRKVLAEIWDYDDPFSSKWVDEPIRFSRISRMSNFSLMLRYTRIPFGHLDPDEMLKLFLEWPNASSYLSAGIMEGLWEYEQSCGTVDSL